MKVPRLVIAGAASGCGKTTVATGIIAALGRLGLVVQPFKAGPDYIDPGYHSLAAGRPSRNLDTWILGTEAVVELFCRSASGCDLALVEGVMGLFDGLSTGAEEGSTAHLAKVLGAPVILVVDASGMARSAAAMVEGYQRFDPGLQLAGVFFNNVGGPGHYRLLKEAVESRTGVRSVGYLARDDALKLPERHLGLVPGVEVVELESRLDRLAEKVLSSLNIEGLLELARNSPNLDPGEPVIFREPRPRTVRIGVARDRAFSFYYQDSLDLLEWFGAELVSFSPLEDPCLPPDLDGLVLGGGFPEVFREELAANSGMLVSVARAAREGMPIYAECGGYMYLSEGIRGQDGRFFPMVGLIPSVAVMQGRRVALGYVIAETAADCILARGGYTVRGHEFHWSSMEGVSGESPAFCLKSRRRGEIRSEGWSRGNLVASYLHLHLASDPRLAANLVEACTGYRRARRG